MSNPQAIAQTSLIDEDRLIALLRSNQWIRPSLVGEYILRHVRRNAHIPSPLSPIEAGDHEREEIMLAQASEPVRLLYQVYRREAGRLSNRKNFPPHFGGNHFDEKQSKKEAAFSLKMFTFAKKEMQVISVDKLHSTKAQDLASWKSSERHPRGNRLVTRRMIHSTTQEDGYFLVNVGQANLRVNQEPMPINSVIGPFPGFAVIETDKSAIFWWRSKNDAIWIPPTAKSVIVDKEDKKGKQGLEKQPTRKQPPRKKRMTKKADTSGSQPVKTEARKPQEENNKRKASDEISAPGPKKPRREDDVKPYDGPRTRTKAKEIALAEAMKAKRERLLNEGQASNSKNKEQSTKKEKSEKPSQPTAAEKAPNNSSSSSLSSLPSGSIKSGRSQDRNQPGTFRPSPKSLRDEDQTKSQHGTFESLPPLPLPPPPPSKPHSPPLNDPKTPPPKTPSRESSSISPTGDSQPDFGLSAINAQSPGGGSEKSFKPTREQPPRGAKSKSNSPGDGEREENNSQNRPSGPQMPEIPPVSAVPLAANEYKFYSTSPREWERIFVLGMERHKRLRAENEARNPRPQYDRPYQIDSLIDMSEEDVIFAIGSFWTRSPKPGGGRSFAFAGLDFFTQSPNPAIANPHLRQINVVGGPRPFIMPLLMHQLHQPDAGPPPPGGAEPGHIILGHVQADPEGKTYALTVYDSLRGHFDNANIRERAYWLLERAAWPYRPSQYEQGRSCLTHGSLSFKPVVSQQTGKNTCGFHTILAAWSILMQIPFGNGSSGCLRRGYRNSRRWDNFYAQGLEIVNLTLAGYMDTMTILAYFQIWGLGEPQNIPIESSTNTPIPPEVIPSELDTQREGSIHQVNSMLTNSASFTDLLDEQAAHDSIEDLNFTEGTSTAPTGPAAPSDSEPAQPSVNDPPWLTPVLINRVIRLANTTEVPFTVEGLKAVLTKNGGDIEMTIADLRASKRPEVPSQKGEHASDLFGLIINAHVFKNNPPPEYLVNRALELYGDDVATAIAWLVNLTQSDSANNDEDADNDEDLLGSYDGANDKADVIKRRVSRRRGQSSGKRKREDEADRNGGTRILRRRP